MQADYSWIPPDQIHDIDLPGEYLRQNFAKILPQWAKAPPFYVMQNGNPQLVCSRYNDVVDVLTDNERFSTVRPLVDPASAQYVQYKPDKFSTVETLPQMDGAKHARIRRLIAAPFSASAIAKLARAIDAALDKLVAGIQLTDGVFDLMPAFARELMVVALLDTVLQLDDAQKQAFIRMNRALPLTAKKRPGETFPQEYLDAFAQTTTTINALIRQRREKPGADIVSDLILTRDGSDLLSDKELFDLIFTFSAAALESTAASMGGIVLTLCRNPDIFSALKQNPDLLPAAIEEGLRLHGPGIIIVTRYALQDTEVGGVEVRKGVPVYVSPQAANFDPEQYPEPLRFEFNRPQRKILTFGGGIHFCAGNRLARYVLQTGLQKLLQHFSNLRLADPDFTPHYFGTAGEIQLSSLPLRVD